MSIRTILQVAVLALPGIAVLVPSARSQSIWELTPYRVKVVVALEPAGETTPELGEELVEAVRDHIGAFIGAAWDAQTTLADGARAQTILGNLDGLTKEDIPFEERRDFDKIISVAVGSGSGQGTVRAREFDVQTERFSTPAELPLPQWNKLSSAVFQAVFQAFAPLARIQKSEKADDGTRTAFLRLRAAGLPIRDPALRFVHEADLFLPIVRFNDREGNPKRIIPIEWTFFVVKEIAPDFVVCDVVTGLRSPLTGRRRGRVELYALFVKAPPAPTTLVLQGEKEPHDRLSGYEVYAKTPDVKMPELLGRTNLAGELVVPPGKERIREVLIKNGSSLLARLPILPGLAPEQVAYIPNDDSRLEAEGFLKGLQEELIDVVVRREILKARIRKRLAGDTPEDVDELLDRLRKLPTRDEFSLQLNKAKNRLISDNPALQQQIDAMFQKTEVLLGGQLDPEEINQVSLEVSRAKQGAKPATP